MWQIVKSLEHSTSKQEKESDERLKVMLEVEKKRDELFLKFQREEAQANRDHELVMAHLLLHAGINQLIKRKTVKPSWHSGDVSFLNSFHMSSRKLCRSNVKFSLVTQSHFLNWASLQLLKPSSHHCWFLSLFGLLAFSSSLVAPNCCRNCYC